MLLSVCTKNLHRISTLIQVITIWALKICSKTKVDVLDLSTEPKTNICGRSEITCVIYMLDVPSCILTWNFCTYNLYRVI